MVAVKVAEVILHALEKFPDDREIATVAFRLLSLTLKGPKDRKVKLFLTQNGITERTDKYMDMYRIDTEIISGIMELRTMMPRNIHPTPEMIHEVEKTDSDSDSDSDDESVTGKSISSNTNNIINKDKGSTKPPSSIIVESI